MASYLVPDAGLTWLQTHDLEAETLYLGFIDESGFTGFASTDTMASHSGWTELTTYSLSTRPGWINTGSSGGIISNTPGAQITITAVSSIIGFFLTDSPTKGGVTSTLIVESQADVGAVSRAIGEVYTALQRIRYKSGGG